jgi:hypothetical protein
MVSELYLDARYDAVRGERESSIGRALQHINRPR